MQNPPLYAKLNLDSNNYSINLPMTQFLVTLAIALRDGTFNMPTEPSN